ncbi:hypothetical protein FTUN_7516 [Frigoriglobus tundricola]|uniref:Uncharacterized protein n=1 Tax=Frigoriglobus tundricola TaxID=2774151 RepID=A0A6M5Z305_9BACT|nr:hypothetical protein FTUN_7516 [Frigoriglobus tundricola]
MPAQTSFGVADHTSAVLLGAAMLGVNENDRPVVAEPVVSGL